MEGNNQLIRELCYRTNNRFLEESQITIQEIKDYKGFTKEIEKPIIKTKDYINASNLTQKEVIEDIINTFERIKTSYNKEEK